MNQELRKTIHMHLLCAGTALLIFSFFVLQLSNSYEAEQAKSLFYIFFYMMGAGIGCLVIWYKFNDWFNGVTKEGSQSNPDVMGKKND